MQVTRIVTVVSLIAGPLWGCAGDFTPVDNEPFKILGTCPDNLAGVGCISVGDTPTDSNPPAGSLPPKEGGCWITGIGTFGKGVTRDSFGGNGMTMKDGSVRGEWEHVDHFDVSGSQKNGQNIFHGQVEYLHCKIYPTLNGPQVPKAEPNFANWGGHGVFNHQDGYTFDVRAFDHAEGGIYHDRYAITIKDSSGKIVLQADGKSTNNITNGPSGSMQAKGNGSGTTTSKGKGKGSTSTASTSTSTSTTTSPRNTSCREDPTIQSADLAWVAELGCLSGGNFQIHPPNKGHPYNVTP